MSGDVEPVGCEALEYLVGWTVKPLEFNGPRRGVAIRVLARAVYRIVLEVLLVHGLRSFVW